MNNWEDRPEISVICGGHYTNYVQMDTVANTLNITTTSDECIEGRDLLVGNTDNLKPDHLQMVLGALIDHLDQTPMADWMYRGDDIYVEDEDIWVGTILGTYHGPNCIVRVIYVAEV